MDRNSSHIFDDLLSTVEFHLGERGFARRRWTFVKTQPKQTHLFIIFEKSETFPRFTISLGINSGLLVDHGIGRRQPRGATDCHWNTRIGNLLPVQGEHWWTISSDTRFEALSSEVIEVIDKFCLPVLMKGSTNCGLRDMIIYQSRAAPFLTTLARLEYLSILIPECGTPDRLDEFYGEIRQFAWRNPHAREQVDRYFARAGLPPLGPG